MRSPETEARLPPIRFLHIPKTAGTTFGIMLQRIYGSPHFEFNGSIILDRERHASLSAQEQHAVRLYFGHAPLSTGLAAVDRVPVITFLRDPIDLVKSFCQFVAEGKYPAYAPAGIAPETFPVDAFLESGNVELSNIQTKLLILGDIHAETLPSAALARKRATEALMERVDSFGLTEMFDESLVYFMTRYSWPLPHYTSYNAKNPKRLVRFEPRHIHRIAQMNHIDIQIYEAARTVFAKSIGCDDNIARQVDLLRGAQHDLATQKLPLVRRPLYTVAQ